MIVEKLTANSSSLIYLILYLPILRQLLPHKSTDDTRKYELPSIRKKFSSLSVSQRKHVGLIRLRQLKHFAAAERKRGSSSKRKGI